MKKNLLSTLLSSILSLFLALVIFAFTVLSLVGNVLVPDYLLTHAADSGYTRQMYDQIHYEWENLLAITGVREPEPILGVLTGQGVHQHCLSYLESAYAGTPTLDTQPLQQSLEAAIRAYVDSTPQAADPQEQEQNIQDLISACIAYYRQSVMLPGAGTLLGYAGKLSPYTGTGMAACGAAALVLCGLLFFLQPKRRSFAYYASWSTGANALLFLAVPALVRHYRILDRLPLQESAMKTLLTASAQGLVSGMENAGVALLLSTLALLGLYAALSAIQHHRLKKAEP